MVYVNPARIDPNLQMCQECMDQTQHSALPKLCEPITTDQLLSIHHQLCESARALMERKNHDYSGEGDTPFLNFEQCENLKLCSTEAGLLVRLSDKLTRLACFLRTGELKVEDEKLEDTVLDMLNYVVLFAAYCRQKTNTGL